MSEPEQKLHLTDKEKLRILKEAYTQLKEEKKDLEVKLAKLSALEEANSLLQQEKQELEARLKSIEDKQDEDEKEKKIKTLQKRVEELEAQISIFNRDRALLVHQVKELKESKQGGKASSAHSLESLEKQVEDKHLERKVVLPKAFSLRSFYGKFLCTSQAVTETIIANRSKALSWEKFIARPVPGFGENAYAIITHTNKYVTAKHHWLPSDNQGYLSVGPAATTEPGLGQVFIFQYGPYCQGAKVAIRSLSEDAFITSDDQGKVQCNLKEISAPDSHGPEWWHIVSREK